MPAFSRIVLYSTRACSSLASSMLELRICSSYGHTGRPMAGEVGYNVTKADEVGHEPVLVFRGDPAMRYLAPRGGAFDR